MKNKNIFIFKLIGLIPTIIFLIYIFIKSQNMTTRIIMIPFLICGFAMLGKNIFLIMNKEKYAKTFNNLYIISFLLYWFGFLIYWCYLNVINRNYFLLLLSIPFWAIGIGIIYKFLLKKDNKVSNKHIKSKLKPNMKFNFKIIISGCLVGISLLAGIVMLFFGIKETYRLNKITKNYLTTSGYFDDYNIYNSDEDGTTYRLTYIYTVNDKEYTISTDYGTNYIPDKNSIREVKYNPENPEEAILVGTNSKKGLIFLGGFFTLVSFTFILFALFVQGYFDKLKIDIIGTYIGAVCLIIGIGIIWFQTGTTLSLMETIKSFGLWILIPFMFIVVGIIQILKSTFLKNKEK